MNRPLLSIVIANYNYGRFLDEAIKSVISQDMGDKVELIICDAASTDNSVEIIKKYANGLPPNTSLYDWEPGNSQLTTKDYRLSTKITWWCSEPDKGQSEAFNKGFAHARGRYLTWLNADDLLVPGSLKRIIASLRRHPNCEWFTGNFYRFEEKSKLVSEIGWGPRFYPAFLQFPRSPVVVFGPTSFFSKKIYEEVGKIDERFHLMMDTDLWVRFMLAGIKQRRIAHFCWAFRMHELSKTAEYGDHRLSEKRKLQFRVEMDLMYEKTRYKPMRLLYYLLLVWRILDLSLIEKMLYHMCVLRVAR